MIDDFEQAINGIEVQKEYVPFNLVQLKVEYFHWNNNDVEENYPISTSIEFEKKDDEVWKKTINHKYFYLKNDIKTKENKEENEISFNDPIIMNISKNDLRLLLNNYYSDEEPDNYSHWEVTYNYLFKIVGTDDQIPEEIKEIFNAIDLEEEIKKEKDKVIEENI